MEIPFMDLKRQALNLKPEILEVLEEVLSEGTFTSGPQAEAFERDFARFCSSLHCTGVNSGTSALYLCLKAAGTGPGDEVIVPANSFIATSFAVSYTGAVPVFADCEPDTWQIDPLSVSKKISPATKAVIGVHLYGQPFNVEGIRKAAGDKVLLIEDAAQAQGALYKGKRTGSLGDLAAFSFYPTKNLGTYGESGAVISNNEDITEVIRSLRNNGSNQKHLYDRIGYNMRMGELEAAVLNIKLRHIEEWNKRRKQIAYQYRENIINPRLQLQRILPDTDPVFHLFVVLAEDRNKFLSYLSDNGIGYGLHYPVPCHLQKAYRHLGYRPEDLPVSEKLSAKCVSLPVYPELEDAEVERIIEVVNSY